ncbi:DUF411 domain-containing protein [Janibacter sp. GS2]|uniref:DUF411 domain-containing protein n=1 Tax=Janibacter sp. GS2 TaxID=3442646 RepID=UPI003EB95FFA
MISVPINTSSHTSPVLDRRSLLLLAGLGSTTLLAACSDGGSTSTATQSSLPPKVAASGVAAAQLAMTVSKDPSCGCCSGWIEHAEDNGFSVTTEHPERLHEVWERHDIPLDLQSCHLASNRDGHVFVGHVPARFIVEYLADPPRGARGLSVPAMPVGTPGMEQGEAFDPYDVLLITEGGSTVFAKVTRASQQSI